MEKPKLKEEAGKWQEYYELTKNQPPRKLLIEAVQYVTNKDQAIDLGAGAFNDVRFLISAGFKHVTAVDVEPVAEEDAAKIPKDKLTHTISSFEDFDFPAESYDLVNAQYSLPFCAPQEFKALFDKITHSLKSGGVFTGQFFGPRDSWNDGRVNMTFLPEEEAREILNNFKIIKFTEEEADKKPAVGSIKHWHIFHIIASKI